VALCQNCKKKEATFFFKSLINGQETRIDLCASCAHEKGGLFSFESGPDAVKSAFPSLTELIAEFAGVSDKTAPPDTRCKACGLGYARFQQTGLLGCAKCYDSFSAHLQPLLNRIHGAAQHTGKTYDNPLDLSSPTRQKTIEQLEKELDGAVKKENFEKAAQLRDQIRQLRNRS